MTDSFFGKGVLVSAALVLIAAPALGDAVGYAKVVDLRAESDGVVLEHHHDWSRATEAARYEMITKTKDPFTDANTYAYLRLVDKASGRELFKKPVPALTHLYIAPGGRYLVGLSNLKLWNPYQIVVFSRSGRRVFQKSINASSWNGILESVTNVVDWFREPPVVTLVEERGGDVTLTIEDRQGTPRAFRFRGAP